MDIYSKKSRWKLYLLVAALFIVAISLFYTNSVAEKIAKQEEQRAELWAKAVQEMSAPSDDSDTLWAEREFKFISGIVIDNNTIPAIVTDERGNIITWSAAIKDDADSSYLERQKRIMAATNEPILIDSDYGVTNYVYYKNSQLYTILTYFPYFQLGLILIFLFVGYLSFSSARRAEQNQVWVGMAKETAHQLGTPISAIVAWIEHLKQNAEGDEYTLEILKEFRNDVGRLELITERFSKIGSKPELQEVNVVNNLQRNIDYMQRRASKRVRIDFAEEDQKAVMGRINPPLFDWVLENLLKNALDAMSGKGEILVNAFEDADFVYIDVSDTGKGIPASKFKTVFQPGYSTKKRGWGLGLSLTTRIIKNYHNGKIFVKNSEIGKGTTFRIQLPKK